MPEEEKFENTSLDKQFRAIEGWAIRAMNSYADNKSQSIIDLKNIYNQSRRWIYRKLKRIGGNVSKKLIKNLASIEACSLDLQKGKKINENFAIMIQTIKESIVLMQETRICEELILGETKWGKKVLANREFSVGEEVIEFTGKLIRGAEIPPLLKPEDDRYLQMGMDLYMGPSGKYDDLINHSCDPNTGLKFIGGRIILIAIRKIRKGEEVTWDYSTTMDEDEWEMDCLCGSKICRGKIKDFKYLPGEIQKRYIALGIVPKYIIENMHNKKTNPAVK